MKFKNIKKNQPKKVYAPRKSKVTQEVKVEEQKVEKGAVQQSEKKDSKEKITPKKKKTFHLPHFPSNYRFITERRFWVIILAIIAFSSLMFVGIDIYFRIQQLNNVKLQRALLFQKEQMWESVTQQKPGYRDGYVEVAQFAYQLGDKNTALVNINSALLLDPNFKPALELKGLIETLQK